MFTLIRNAITSLILFTVLTGILYPLSVTGLAQALFPRQSNGSFIMKNGNPVGSALIGQQFDKPGYFWGRPSATGPFPYNAASSSGSNLGPNNPALALAVRARTSALRTADPSNRQEIPVDLATASGSGLDPHISPAAAAFQVRRVATARGLYEATVRAAVAAHTRQRLVGVLGEPVVNVLELNLALDELR
ncbi:MAG: potassium-transporting ATPase subunit KdpC [Deltaproteobacteria bacterium]|nr:potassium-transporting ATPase subunit KdpC [Deltaproteobacteria bacterium]